MYVKLSCYGGFCHQDMSTVMEQLTFNGDFFIPEDKVSTIIVDFLVNSFPYMEREIFEDAIENKKEISFPIKREETDENGNTIYVDCETINGENGIWYEQEAYFDGEELILQEDYMYGQGSYKTTFKIEDIQKENVWYLVEEVFVGPYKYCDVIERIYIEPFENIENAKVYFESFKTHTNISGVNGKKKIFVADKNKIQQTEWFKLNKEAITLMRYKDVTNKHESFAINVRTHIENLKKL